MVMLILTISFLLSQLIPGFGQPTSTAGFGFGQSSNDKPSFGQSSAFGQTPTSSSASSGSLFGGSAGGSGGGGGFGGFGGLGGKPSEEKAKTNVFGTPQTFGGSTTGQTQG